MYDPFCPYRLLCNLSKQTDPGPEDSVGDTLQRQCNFAYLDLNYPAAHISGQHSHAFN